MVPLWLSRTLFLGRAKESVLDKVGVLIHDLSSGENKSISSATSPRWINNSTLLLVKSDGLYRYDTGSEIESKVYSLPKSNERRKLLISLEGQNGILVSTDSWQGFSYEIIDKGKIDFDLGKVHKVKEGKVLPQVISSRGDHYAYIIKNVSSPSSRIEWSSILEDQIQGYTNISNLTQIKLVTWDSL